MLSRHVWRVLISVGLIVLVTLLVAVFVIGALAWLLGAMGDAAGRSVLGWIAGGLGVLTVIDLVLLVAALCVRSLEEGPDEPPEGPS